MRFSAMRAAVVMGGLVGVLAAGCGDDEGGTRIVITVDSDIGPNADPRLTKVKIDVEGTVEPATANATLADDPLPRELTLLYGGGSRGPLRITATGTLSDDTKLTQTRGEVFFEDGEQVKVSLELVEACLGVACADGQTCIDGTCRGEAFVPDGGAPDGGGGSEAGLDAGTEAGVEAGTEAGVDAGPDVVTSCTGDGDCVDLDDACMNGVCDMGTCVAQPKADATPCDGGLCLGGECVPARPCPNGSCNLSCNGVDSCVFDCKGATDCGVRCNGASCIVDCGDAETCTNVRCAKGECLLLCGGAMSCGFNNCGPSEMTCGDDFVCGGRDCP